MKARINEQQDFNPYLTPSTSEVMLSSRLPRFRISAPMKDGGYYYSTRYDTVVNGIRKASYHGSPNITIKSRVRLWHLTDST